jgi:hypothetical protein
MTIGKDCGTQHRRKLLKVFDWFGLPRRKRPNTYNPVDDGNEDKPQSFGWTSGGGTHFLLSRPPKK